MDKKENSLIVKKENIFKRIFSFFKGLLRKKTSGNSIEDLVDDSKDNYDEEKKRMFELYNDFKNYKIDEKDLNAKEKIIIDTMLKEEIDIRYKKILDLDNEER